MENFQNGSTTAGAAGCKKPSLKSLMSKPKSHISSLTMFLYAILLISLWQTIVHLGSHFYSIHDNRPKENQKTEEDDARQMQREWNERLNRSQAQILDAIESVRTQLKSLEERARPGLATSSRDHHARFTNLTKALELGHESSRRTMSESTPDIVKRLDAHISETTTFRPLKDVSKWHHLGDDGEHGFMSLLHGRGRRQGPPEFFRFPSSSTAGKLLCLRGNHTTDGTLNSYAFSSPERLPMDAVLLPGTALISETYWDFNNPWHAMYNLAQFVHWRMDRPRGRACPAAKRLLLYHWGEVRTELGYWIKNVLDAVSLPTEPERLMGNDDRPVCFQEAVVSRIGIGGMPQELARPMFEEIRCAARRKCGVSRDAVRADPSGGEGSLQLRRKVRLLLLARNKSRTFADLTEWENVIGSVCTAAKDCSSSTVLVANLNFCQQVEFMSKTDILVSVHGAQLTNMVFMSPGSRVLEMFPYGWEEFAGHGQFIYSSLASWVGLRHEGYWRDINTPRCPKPSIPEDCFSFYKDQPVGMNATHVSSWLSTVINSFNHAQAQAPLPRDNRDDPNYEYKWDKLACSCAA